MKYNNSRVRVRLFGATLLALTAALSARADYQSTVLSQGPVGYWRLSETTQPPPPPVNATNIGSAGTPTGDGVYYKATRGVIPGAIVSQPNNGSVLFTDPTDVVGTPQGRVWMTNQPAWDAGGPFSVEFWVKPSRTSVAQCVAANVEFIATPLQRNGWLIYQGDSAIANGNGFVFRLYNSTGLANQTGVSVNMPLSTSLWYHVVGTFDGSSIKLYTNGNLAGTATIAGTYRQNTNAAIPLTFGARGNGASGSFTALAAFDEAAYYSTTLSASQVLTHYQAGTNASPATPYEQVVATDSPKGYWRFNEPPDVKSPNIGTLGSSANATYQVGTTPGVAGPRPSAYAGFETTNNSVNVPGTGPSVSAPALNLNTNTVTISGWVKASGVQSNAGGIIMCDGGTTYAGLNIDVSFGGLGLGYTWNNDAGTYNWSPSVDAGFPPLPDSDWAFVALVIQPTNASIYMANANNPLSFTGVTNYWNHANEAFDAATLFGSDGGDPAYSFKGAIDEVAIFNRALGLGELYSQYAAAVGGIGPKIFADPQTPVDPVYAGDTLQLSVDAGGTPDLSFQWYKTGGAISGATNSVFSKVNAQTSDSDNYYVIITNLFGNVTSASTSVTVNPAFAPTIITPPVARTLYPGATLNLSVVASGGGLKYQWKKGGVDILGATSATYQIPSVTTNNTGSYSVIVSNNISTVTGGPVTVTVLAPANGYESAIVADAPEAWYRLNETSGADMFDSMGRHDGIYTNISGSPVTFGAAGAVVGSGDTAVTFDGTSMSYGVVPFSTRLNSPRFAIEAWVKTTDVTGTRCAVSSRSAVPEGYWLYTFPAGSWSGGVSDSGNNYYVPSATAADAIVAGEWKHVVMVYDTSLKVYVNGQWDNAGYVDFDRNASAPFIIGGQGGSAVTLLFNGQVDEVLVYTNALTLAQAQNHYSKAKFASPIAPFFLIQPQSDQVVSNPAVNVTLSGSADGPIPLTYQWYKDGNPVANATNASVVLSATYSNAGSYVLRATNPNGFTNSAPASFAVIPPNPPFVNVTNGLVLHLKFEGNYSDSSGRANNGTAVGAPTIVPGRFGNGVFLSTSNGVPEYNYITLGNPADLRFSSNVNFSVAYWVKYEAGQTNGDLPFLCTAVNSYGNAGYTFAPSYKQGGWSYSLNGTVQTYGAVNTLNNGSWHHVLHTFNRTGNAVTYLDGAQVDTRLVNGAGDLDTGNAVTLGQDPSGLYPEDGSVTLDDLAVWRRALTSYEAYSTYYAATNSNSSFDVPGTVTLKISPSGTNVVLSWQPGATLGTLLQADSPTGPWTAVPVFTPVYQVSASATQKYYRLSFIE